jgi:hemolysin D
VKIDAFNFTKYGTIDGTILDISNDAFQDEKMGLIFKTRVGLKKEDMLIDGRTINLGPGMSVTAEVVTGNRRVIEFIVNPVRKILNESATER